MSDSDRSLHPPPLAQTSPETHAAEEIPNLSQNPVPGSKNPSTILHASATSPNSLPTSHRRLATSIPRLQWPSRDCHKPPHSLTHSPAQTKPETPKSRPGLHSSPRIDYETPHHRWSHQRKTLARERRNLRELSLTPEDAAQTPSLFSQHVEDFQVHSISRESFRRFT